MTEASTASVRMGRVAGYVGRMGRRVGWDVGSDGSGLRTGRTGRMPQIGRRGRSEALDLSTRGVRRYAGRTSVQSDDSPSDITGNL